MFLYFWLYASDITESFEPLNGLVADAIYELMILWWDKKIDQ